MAARAKTTGTDELSAMLGKQGREARRIASFALYDGAAVVADAYESAVWKIRTAPFKYARPGEKRLPSPEEVAAIADKVGIAKFRGDGSEVQTLVGLQEAGYTAVKFKHMKRTTRTNYKLFAGNQAIHSEKAKTMGAEGGLSAKPVGVIANSINSGTSFMQKQPVFRKAARGATAKALEAMEKTAIRLIAEIANE